MRSIRRAMLSAFSTLFFVILASGWMLAAAPSITSISPTSGPSGTSVIITGTNFGNTKGTGSTVTFGGVVASTTAWGNKSITAVVPTGVSNGAVSVVVTVGGLASNSNITFTVANPITIQTLTPPSGPSGTSVTIAGSNFGSTKGTSTVKFGTIVASTTSWSNTSIVAVVPNGIVASTVGVVVTVNNTASNTVNFPVTNPFIASISVNSVLMNSAPENQLVTINGSGFGATQGTNSSVKFNGLVGVPSSWSDTAISVPVPTGATTGSLVVKVNANSSPGYPFMVTPATQPPGVHFIQGDYLVSDSVPSSATIAFPIAQTGGDLNAVIVGWRGSYNVAVSDSASNTYVLAVGPTAGSAYTQSIYYAKNISGASSNSVKVTFTPKTQSAITQISVDIRIAEYSGLSTSSPLDVVAAASGTSSTADSGFATTTNQNDVLVGAGMADGVISGAGSNYTMRVIPINANANNSDILEDRIVTATGSYHATAVLPVSHSWLMQMAAFKESANQAPVVNAGSNQTITLPTNSTTLHGTATDDGLPNNALTISWTEVSGPGTVTFNTPNAAVTDATFPVAGTYVLQLTANDSQLSSSSNVTVTVNAQINSALTLQPLAAGPDVTGSSQTMTALLKTSTGPTGTPISGVSVLFTVTGPNATSGSRTTDATGTATFTYTGANSGTDTVTASYAGQNSNSANVSWLTPVQNVSTGTILGRFFLSDGSGSFDTLPTATPAFSLYLPTINFNPPSGTVPGTPSNINVNTRPFTDVTTDLNGNFTGSIVAQGNGYQAGIGAMFAFQAVFTGTLTVATAGNKTINFNSDDGFVVGVGGGASRVSGPMLNAPPSGLTAFTGLPVMGAYNTSTGPVANAVVVNFPAPGTYPYELDYTECCSGPLALEMTIGGTNTPGVPPTGTLFLSPTTPSTLPTGQAQAFTVLVTDASGVALSNTTVALAVSGANLRQLTAATDSTGHAAFQYTGTNGGTDTIQATANVSGLGEYSNTVNMTWTVAVGSGAITFTPQGWIGSPTIGTVVQGQVPISVAAGENLTSGTLTYWPTSSPAAVTTLNSNTTGAGTIGTFDATILAGGGYTIQLNATDSNNNTQVSQITVSVVGENKPGRMKSTVTEFKVPLAGIPISITRTYDSLDKNKIEDFGYGWKLGTFVDLSVDAQNNVTLNFNGQKITFFFNPQPVAFFLPWLVPQYTPQSGVHGSLASDGCGGLLRLQTGIMCFPNTGQTYQPNLYAYTDPVGRVYTISATGQLQSIQDLNGNTITVTPTGITSSVGSANITFQRDGTGRITDIYDTNQNHYQYSYDPSTSELASVQYPGISAAETYVYDTPAQDCPTSPSICVHLLKSEIDPRGNSSSATYDAAGRLKSVTGPSVPDPNGGTGTVQFTTQYSYNLSTNTTTITNPDLGTVTRQDDSFGKPLSITEKVDASTSRTTTYQYDSSENLLQVTDPLNHVTKYSYDANGFQTSVQLPGLLADSTTYNQFGGVKSHTDAAGTNTISTSYDANFNPSQVTDTLVGSPSVATFSNYDSMGNFADSTDANGKATHFDYYQTGPQAGYLQDVIRNNSQEKTSYTYDPMGKVLTVKDACGNGSCPDVTVGTTHIMTYGYDQLERLTSVLDPAGFTTKYQYDNNGNKTDQFDGCVNNLCQRQTHWDYDNLNRVMKITYPDTTTKQFTYDFRGNKTTETDQLGHVTKYVYDLSGQLSSVTSANLTADVGTVSYTYYLDGRQHTITDERNNVTTNFYDPAGRLTSVQDALGNTTSYGYDANSRKASVTEPNNQAAALSTTYQYDARGRVKVITYPPTPTQPATTMQYPLYDGMGRVLTSLDQGNNTTTKTYDDVGRLKTVTDALTPANTTTYTYDLNGNLQSLKDANQHTTQYQYDTMNRRVRLTLPLPQFETYQYDALGRLQFKSDFNGKTTQYNYDSMDRLLSKVPDASLGQPTNSFTYTATGQRLTMSDPSGTTTYTQYDNRDRLLFKTSPEGNLNYTYDAHGNVLTINSSNTNGASLTYTYDALNRLASAKDNRIAAQGGSSNPTTYSYDATGNLTGYVYPNTVQTANLFDPLNRLTQTCSAASSPACSAGTKLSSYLHGLAPAGNRLSVTEANGRLVSYLYDTDYRLTKETIQSDPSGNNGAVSYTGYDPVGNRTVMSSSLNAVPGGTFSYDANDRLTTDLYDANGNTTSSGSITNLYDFENRMTAHGSLTLTYDGDGNRVSETVGGSTTKFLVDDHNPTGLSQVLDELVSGSVTRTYAYGRQRISENQLVNGTWTPSFYGYDGHGNGRFLTNSAGAITDSYDFDAFGMPVRTIGTTPNQFLYSGERYDSSIGLYDLRARYLNQATGRFWARDPIESGWSKGRPSCCRSCSPLQLNPYIYANDDPVDRVDPTGKQSLTEYLLVTAFVVTAAITTYYILDPCWNIDGPNPYGNGYQCFYRCFRSGIKCSYPWLPYCPQLAWGNTLAACM